MQFVESVLWYNALSHFQWFGPKSEVKTVVQLMLRLSVVRTWVCTFSVIPKHVQSDSVLRQTLRSGNVCMNLINRWTKYVLTTQGTHFIDIPIYSLWNMIFMIYMFIFCMILIYKNMYNYSHYVVTFVINARASFYVPTSSTISLKSYVK